MFYKESSILFPLLVVLGAVLGVLFIFKKVKPLNFSKKSQDRFIIILCYGGIAFYLGSRFFDDLFHYLNGEGWGNGGITFLAGCLTGLVVFVILIFFFLKDERKHIFKIFNIVAMGIILGHAVGRLGCFSAGCCYGKVTDSFIGINFPGEGYRYEGNGIYTVYGSDAYKKLFQEYLETSPSYQEGVMKQDNSLISKALVSANYYARTTKVVPTQLIESLFLILLFIILLKVNKLQFPIYLISYSVYRFFAEYLRFDNRGATTLGISPSQLMSIVGALVGIGILITYIYFKKKKQIEI